MYSIEKTILADRWKTHFPEWKVLWFGSVYLCFTDENKKRKSHIPLELAQQIVDKLDGFHKNS